MSLLIEAEWCIYNVPVCVSKLTIIGSDNGLPPGQHQAIICTNARILLIGPLGTNFSKILIKIQTFSLKKRHLKTSSMKCCQFRLGLNVLTSMAINQQLRYFMICNRPKNLNSWNGKTYISNSHSAITDTDAIKSSEVAFIFHPTEYICTQFSWALFFWVAWRLSGKHMITPMSGSNPEGYG